jgi:hypothetical protein
MTIGDRASRRREQGELTTHEQLPAEIGRLSEAVTTAPVRVWVR